MMLSAVPTDAVCTETVTELRHQETVLTLLRHCQSMKRQKMRLRLATGFIIVMACAVIFFLHYHKRSSTTVEPTTAALQEPIVQVQHVPRPSQMFYFEVTAVPGNAEVLKWRNHTTQNITSILIPTDGLYFVYLNIPYRMTDTNFSTKFQHLSASVTRYRKAYPKPQRDFWFTDTIACVYPNFRNIYTGRLIRLKADDKLEVTATPNDLIDWSYNGVFFGGYLVRGPQNQN